MHMQFYRSYVRAFVCFLDPRMIFKNVIFNLDVNECDAFLFCNCTDKETCVNTNGSCECKCLKGFTFFNRTECLGM